MSQHRQMKAASSAAFDKFIAMNLVTLVGYIKMHVNNAGDENGRLQDTLLAAIQASSDFKGDSSFLLRLCFGTGISTLSRLQYIFIGCFIFANSTRMYRLHSAVGT